MTAVAWPGRRGDVMEALAILATLQPPAPTSWPGLTEAVDWLVNDTLWDQRSPADAIGTILVNVDEADAIAATLRPLLAIIDELEPTGSDDDYLTHPRWPEVTRAAATAYQLMASQTPAETETAARVSRVDSWSERGLVYSGSSADS